MYETISKLHPTISTLLLGLFFWLKPKASIKSDIHFSYYDDNQDVGLMKAMLFASLLEIVAVHVLLIFLKPSWSLPAFILGFLGFIYVIGILKSWKHSPVKVDIRNGVIETCWGFSNKHTVPFSSIRNISKPKDSQELRRDKEYVINVFLAEPNIALNLIENSNLPIKSIHMVLDNPRDFERAIEDHLKPSDTAA
ncbi:hypothetical protein KFE96_04535 [Kordiimonas sp. SCSIO 12603]|uniref:hypothetical protein n=1 Tax=Kordiimonas sp. SCSIO 12603 TaxID=2829596 RepID=UPI0021029556|nr:hypothetical protein [Kordiimonas sp. SCSIO 12603]UTW59580.1 hypothetical protein KFE96_04535 [Kordiimonas sp. SCSIO 12603]